MSNKKEKKSGGKKALKVILIILAVIAAFIIVTLVIDHICAARLVKYIDSFAPVDYSGTDRVLPGTDENGHVSFKTDGDLNVMFLTDLHECVGRWSFKKDKKTIYEVINMLQTEKPDVVILGGDNTFAVPGPIYRGGGSLDNKMAAKIVLHLFEHEGVYFSTAFGNHDAEVFDLYSREDIGKLYESDDYPHCLFISEFTDPEALLPSVSNQFISVRNAEDKIVKLLLLFDTNTYVDKSIKAVLDWNYDTIHPVQVDWAKKEIEAMSKAEGLTDGNMLKTIAFFHIPIGEYELAYKELINNGMKPTANSEYVSGFWDEEIDEDMGGRIWFGGCSRFGDDPAAADDFFETLGPDGINSLEACICGHDHVNTAAVKYKGVGLIYGNSMDNTAYDHVAESGLQRGCMMITIHQDGSFEEVHKNAYTDLGVSTQEFVNVYLDRYYYEGGVPAI